jgi:trehalose-6-phosphate synthase
MAMIQLAKAIAERRVKMILGNLDKLIRLESFLRDEPDPRQEVVFANLKSKSTEELRDMVRTETEMLKEMDENGPAKLLDGSA